MKYLYILAVVILSFTSIHTVQAQEIVSVEYNSSLAVSVGRLLLFSLGLNVEIENDVDFYIVKYTTTGSDMKRDTASGMFMLPSGVTEPLPIICYQHGTTDGKFDVPSRLGGAYQLGAIFAAKGMAVVAPDFLGMGDSRGFHPYVNAETEATAAVDLIRALKTYLEEQSIEYTDQLFITGYSQGGHAAMALHQYIETEIPNEFTVTASLPMSGPYSISGVMQDVAFNGEEFFFPSYIVYSTRALREIHPDLYQSEDQVFKEVYLPAINEFVNTGEDLSGLNVTLVSQLITENGKSTTRDLFKDSILMTFENNVDHPFTLALRESDVYDWTPEAPVLMLYCPSDDQVSYKNSIVADSVMNARGAQNVSSEDVSDGRDLDHGDCAIPALARGIPWLFSFIDTTTPTTEIDIVSGLSVFPTLAANHINITTDKIINKVAAYNLSGHLIYKTNPDTKFFKLDVSNFESGMYLLTILTDAGMSTTKVIVGQ